MVKSAAIEQMFKNTASQVKLAFAVFLNMAIPDFRTLDARIDERLNQILHKALSRDLNKRYANADEMLFGLEQADVDQRGIGLHLSGRPY